MSYKLSKIEYRVKPVTRYIVTRYHEQVGEEGRHCGAGSEQRGEFDNADTAYQVGYAMAKLEHEQQGWPVGDMRIIYPTQIQSVVTTEMVDRFLSWKLPLDFGPDCGISFDGRTPDEWNKNKGWPVGTNLFTATQTRDMLEHVLQGPRPTVPLNMDRFTTTQ